MFGIADVAPQYRLSDWYLAVRCFGDDRNDLVSFLWILSNSYLIMVIPDITDMFRSMANPSEKDIEAVGN